MGSMEAIFLPASKQKGFRIEILLSCPESGEIPEESGFPLVVLSDTGRYSRVLAGHVVSEDGRVVQNLALKMQKDLYSLSLEANVHAKETNGSIDRMWERELENLREFSSSGGHVATLFEWGMQQPLKPVFFCKKQRAFLRPHCPECGEALATCREDNLLSRRTLSPYSKGLVRYSCCPACAQSNQDRTRLYTHHPTDADASKQVFGAYQLYKDVFASRIQGTEQLSRDDSLLRELSEDLCCVSCVHQEDCFGSSMDSEAAPVAANHLMPISFYDFYLFPLERLQFRYDDFCKILSASESAKISTPAPQARVPSGAGISTDGSESIVQSRDFMFPPGPERTLELFYLKLSLFCQLCEGVREFHARSRQPHLHLRPENAMVSIPPATRLVPNTWLFDVKLIDLSSGEPFLPDAGFPEFFSGIYRPTRDPDRIYDAPFLNGGFGQQSWVNFTLLESTESPSRRGEAKCEILGTLDSDTMDLRRVSQKDLLHLVLHQEHIGLVGTEFWAKKVSKGGKECRIEGFSQQLQERERERIHLIRNRRIEILASVFPVYNIPCDIHSLGMILLDTLLLNASNDRLDIRDVHQTVCSLLDVYAYNNPEARTSEILNYFNDISKQDRAAKVLSQENMLSQPTVGSSDTPAIPELLWSKALGIAFRLGSGVPGFSFCGDHGDFQDDRPEEKLDKLLSSLHALCREVHTELFHTQQANQRILSVVKSVHDDLAQRSPADVPGPIEESKASSVKEEEKAITAESAKQANRESA